MTTYLGLDVLEIRSDASAGVPTDTSRKEKSEFDADIGKVTSGDKWLASKVGRVYVRTCNGRSEIRAARNWLLARHGQTIPFWIPTWRPDVLLHTAIASGSSSAMIKNTGYSRFYFPHPARRDFAFVLPSGIIYRRAASALDVGDTEELVFGSSMPDVPVDTLICMLTLCRLSTDSPVVEYLSDSVARLTLPYVEVPEETP